MVTIVTHNGQFHADEILAYSILKTIYPDTKLIRTRDKQIIEQGNIIIDVGQVYNPENNKFDHHQTDCHERFNNNFSIDMSSAGMVYKIYGKEFIKKMSNITIPQEDLNIIYQNIYRKLILEVDAIDNGYKQCNNELKYYVNTNISSVINKLNGSNIYDEQEQLKRFLHGSQYILTVAKIIIDNNIINHLLFKKDYKVIETAFKNRINDNIIIITEDCQNWSRCIFTYEKNNNIQKDKLIKYIIYPSNKEWRVRTISQNFESRRLLKEINGYTKEVRDKIIFVHPKRFIASTYDKQTAIMIAIESLKD